MRNGGFPRTDLNLGQTFKIQVFLECVFLNFCSSSNLSYAGPFSTTKEQKGWFFGIILGTLGAGLLANMLTGNRILRVAHGNKQGQRILRVGYGSKMNF